MTTDASQFSTPVVVSSEFRFKLVNTDRNILFFQRHDGTWGGPLLDKVRAEEQKSIVTWLRDSWEGVDIPLGDNGLSDVINAFADAIERGEHRPPETRR